MDNQIEKGPERIPTKEEVMKIISRFERNFVFVRELADEQGLYLLEVKVEGDKPGEITQYEYLRKGRYENHDEASETAIHKVDYENGEVVWGKKVALYNSETGEWEALG
jgi:hypothetical protein